MINLEKKIIKNFYGIYKICGNKFMYNCGSYLIDGKKYKYDKSMYGKQELLYKLAKENSSILEIGVYMGHSILIMLTANPKLKITGLDIDNKFAPKAINYLKKKFLESKINFILGDSIDNLKKIKKNYNLYHIDGDHKPIKIFKEILCCLDLEKKNKKNKIKILFDDVDMMPEVEKQLFSCFKISKFLKPHSKYRNLYIEFKFNENEIKKFRSKYYIILINFFFKNILPLYINKTIRLVLKIFVSKNFLKNLGNFFQRKIFSKRIKKLGIKIKNIK